MAVPPSQGRHRHTGHREAATELQAKEHQQRLAEGQEESSLHLERQPGPAVTLISELYSPEL